MPVRDRLALTVGLVSPSFSAYDDQMPAGFGETRRTVAARFAELLSRRFTVVFPGLIRDEGDAERANVALREQHLDAVVYAPTMVAPPSYPLRALARVEAPIVIWNAPEIDRLPTRWEHAQATAHTTTVGAVMLANVLVRQGRTPIVVTADPTDHAAVIRMLRTVAGAAAGGALRGAVALRIGGWIPGYDDVASSATQLAQLGIAEHDIGIEELQRASERVDPAAATALTDDLSARGWDVEEDGATAASATLALALEDLVATHGARFGTINCHGCLFRQSETVGITACLAVSLLTEHGTPFSCTGDQPAAIALAVGKLLTGASQYCECYTPERDTGLLMIAAGGEGDPAWADEGEPVRVRPNTYYSGKRGAGASLVYRLRRGPATLLSLTPAAERWRLVWATGVVEEARYPELGGPNGMFRFDSGPAHEIISHWIAAGPTHHHALAPGKLDLELPALADALRIEQHRV